MQSIKQFHAEQRDSARNLCLNTTALNLLKQQGLRLDWPILGHCNIVLLRLQLCWFRKQLYVVAGLAKLQLCPCQEEPACPAHVAH